MPLPCQPGHLAFPVTDREHVWFWACRYCACYRVQGDPTWRRP